MTTPPNPPSSPSDPPTEPSGTPIPEDTAPPAPHPIPEGPEDAAPPTPPLSLAKTPRPAPADPEDATPSAEPLSLTKTPRAAPQDAPPRETPAPSHFAPLTPPPTAPQAAPPGAAPYPAPYAAHQGGPGPAPQAPAYPGPAPQANPFAPPGHSGYAGQSGYAGYPGQPGYPVPPARPANHLAVAALVLGLTALCFGAIPFAFWIGALTGLVGLGLGIAAIVGASRGAPRKTMSVIATVLCVLGLFASVGGYYLTVAVIHRASDQVDRRLDPDRILPDDPDPSADPDDTADPDPDPTRGLGVPVPFGSTVDYPNGVRVSLSEPKEYVTKSKYIEVGNAVGMDITITNTSDKPIEVIYALPTVRDEHGGRGKLVFDGATPKMVTGTIRPDATATGFAAYEVPEGTKRITAEVSPVIPGPPARFLGSIG
ncbi:hypothetical protein [Streptomyces sp. NPDC058279]|uniref:hypothetical protein n=1 Tax=Streptomyces sp. NPDC058279 TaxID=3346418 RepID=UPI0036F01B75